ncbi:MAG: uroporphyrinogen-III C-methyltransferase [Deltaproteobacteria bacterium]|nr:uroporphyrinogen-III C-methyltransferase [Deltaproteobacteria bacterium]
MAGKVYLVGAGPGDPSLLTVKGAELLGRAQVVIYDYLAAPELLDLCPPDCRLVDASKRAQDHTLSQEAINALLIAEARAGRLVVRLKGGDPYVFGRGGEEALALARAGVEFEVVPGVSSAIAAASTAGIPLTHRGLASLATILTGHQENEPGQVLDWASLAGPGTLSIVMGRRNLQDILARLIQAGRPPGELAAAIERGTTPDQRVVTGTLESLSELVEKAQLCPPVLVVVGAVVSLRPELGWLERRPLFGKTILIPRARAQASRLAQPLRELGAKTLERPAIQVEPLTPNAPLREALLNLSQYRYLILTSPNGAEIFLRALGSQGLDARALHALQIAVIGPGTAAALEGFGLRPDLVPTRFQAEGLVELFQTLEPGPVLLARAETARALLPETLTRLGFPVTQISLYRTNQLSLVLSGLKADLAPITSASVARGLAAALTPERRASLPTVSIGPITSQAAREAGLLVVAESPEASIKSLVETIVAYFLKAQKP